MEGERTKLIEAVETMVKAVVACVDDVEVKQAEGKKGPIILVKVDERDRGRLIGRQGRTIQAMRTLLGAGAQALGDSAQGLPTIEVDEPGRGR